MPTDDHARYFADHGVAKQQQQQIPLNPPFSKGEDRLREIWGNLRVRFASWVGCLARVVSWSRVDKASILASA
ncbi:hypothetical protein [Luteimonas suaedae]|uniref:hypothetical protein n=1 Tax=Luteimonas suaedae TaxID=2605430 RepID=UPI0011ED4D79|nr:hypothetical protein [Luteimonas suaedae]